jgi:hypothetical protein
MEWVLRVCYDRKSIRLRAKIIYTTPLIEIITVTGRNRSLTFQSNRPLLLAKGLKHRRINWKLVDGSLSNSHLLGAITDLLELHLKDING